MIGGLINHQHDNLLFFLRWYQFTVSYGGQWDTDLNKGILRMAFPSTPKMYLCMFSDFSSTQTTVLRQRAADPQLSRESNLPTRAKVFIKASQCISEHIYI